MDEGLKQKVEAVLAQRRVEHRLLSRVASSHDREARLQEREQAVCQKILELSEEECRPALGEELVDYIDCLREEERILSTVKFRTLIEHPKRS